MQKYQNLNRLMSSRDNWKKRSEIYQSEKRDISFKLRDTQKSRDKWKKEYYEVVKELDEFKKKMQKMQELAKIVLEN